MSNITYVTLRRGLVNTAGPLYQYDYGQILQLDASHLGIDLPSAFEVHFANERTADSSVTQIGTTSDGVSTVSVPDEMLLSGETIFAWLFLHATENDGETICRIQISVISRSAVTNDEPTPEPQSTITQAIAALQSAVSDCEDAVEFVEGISATAETLAAGSSATASYSDGVISLGIPRGDTGATGATGPAGADGQDGSDGVGITSIVYNDDYTLTITYADGETVTTGNIRGATGAQGETGPQGATGPQGEQGPQGVQGIQGETGPQGPQGETGATGAQGPQGEKGDKGDTGATGATGPAGADGQGVPTGGTSGQVLKKSSATDYDTAWGDETSVATSAEVKAGSTANAFVAPSVQDESAFYGLAAAAGDTTQSASANAVGTYTDDALVKIQKMLGVYQAPWELIREETFTNETAQTYIISTDSNSQSFELTDAILCFESPVQETFSQKATHQIIFYNGNANITNTEVGNYTQEANATAHGSISFVLQRNNMLFSFCKRTSTNTNNGAVNMRYLEGFNRYGDAIRVFDSQQYITRIEIGTYVGTGHYILYGRRKGTV